MLYKTKKDAARAMIDEFMSGVPQDFAFQSPDTYSEWEFIAKYYDCDEDDDVIGHCAGIPMWGTVWLVTDLFLESKINEHEDDFAEIGFTIMRHYENDWLMLGIDGAGFDFYEAFWIPMYDYLGLKWHSED